MSPMAFTQIEEEPIKYNVTTDWKNCLDRGLDVFQKFEMNDAFSLTNRLQGFRQAKTFEVTYLKVGGALSLGSTSRKVCS